MAIQVDQSQAEIVALVREMLQTVLASDENLSPETMLLGEAAVLDSVGLITLLVGIEERLGNRVDLAASFMEQDDVEEHDHPFRTVGSLARHIIELSADR